MNTFLVLQHYNFSVRMEIRNNTKGKFTTVLDYLIMALRKLKF